MTAVGCVGYERYNTCNRELWGIQGELPLSVVERRSGTTGLSALLKLSFGVCATTMEV